MSEADGGMGEGLRKAVRGVFATLIDIGHTRLQLAATELEEERLRVARLLLAATAALFLLGIGLVLAAGWVVLWCGPEHRLLALGALSALFFGGGLVALWHWQHQAAAKPPLLQATLAELQKDADAVQGHRS